MLYFVKKLAICVQIFCMQIIFSDPLYMYICIYFFCIFFRQVLQMAEFYIMVFVKMEY